MNIPKNSINVIKDRKKIIFNPQLGLLGTDINSMNHYEHTNDLYGEIEEPGMDREIQGFTFVLTTKCNLNCKYCYSITQNEPLSMKKDEPAKILSYYLRNDADVIIVHFFGGEPTLEMETIKNTVDYLKSIKNKTIYLRISTNGFVKKEDLDYLIDNNFLIAVSNDGLPHKKSMLAKRKGGDIVENTIKYLVSRKALFNIRCTVTKDNLESLAESVSYWKSIGIEHAHVEPYHPIGLDDETELLPDIETYILSFKKMLDVAEKERLWISSGIYMNLLTPSTYFCTGASGRFKVFNPDGSITTCYRVQSFKNKIKDFYIGNWKEKTSNNLKIDNYRFNHKKLLCHSIYSMESCEKCEYSLLCGGGCLMRNLTQGGNITKHDKWICSLKKRLIKDAIIRTWEAISKNNLPIVLGRFVFEYKAFNTPSLGMLKKLQIQDFKYKHSVENVVDLYQVLDINRNIEHTEYKKIARAECI